MRIFIQNKSIYKILVMLSMIILLFTLISLFYMYQKNTHITDTLIENQKSYIQQHLEKEQQRLIDNELAYIEEHARSIVDAVQNALHYNLDKDSIVERVKVFMQQKSIRSLYIYDTIKAESYLSLLKKSKEELVVIPEEIRDTKDLKVLKYPLQIDGNDFGYLKVYYDLIPLFTKIKEIIEKEKREDYTILSRQTIALQKDTYTFLRNNIAIFILFTFIMLLTLFLVFQKYIYRPLAIVQKNLHHFSNFFRDAKKDFIPVEIDSDDKFGAMSKEINENIQTVLSAHYEIEETQKELLFTIGTIAEAHSEERSNHIKRVATYSALLAEQYGLDTEEIKILQDASTLHDIGKIAIPDYILNKPGKLDSHEYEIMKGHTLNGYRMLKYSKKPLLQAAATIAYEHHEKYDGTGYPRGLKGEDIHIYGRIVALADLFDALGSDRVYKRAWDDEKILSLISKQRGKQFDPKLVDIFFEHVEVFKEIRERYRDNALSLKEKHSYYNNFVIDAYKLFDCNPVPMLIVDSQRMIIKVNDRFVTLFGYSKEEMIGKSTSMLTISEDDFFRYEEIFLKTQEGKMKERELQYKKKDGTTFWVRLEGTAIEQRDQRPYVLWSFLDIDQELGQKNELQVLNYKLQDMLYTDPLTNLYNKRYLMETGDDIVTFHQNEHISLCVLMLDIDHFKKLNDTYGHPQGDAYLKYFADMMLKLFRENDIICRYGGEEFTVIMKNSNLEEAESIAQNFRRKIKIHSTPSITVSIGITSLYEGDHYMRDIIERADKALYRAKRGGRDRVVITSNQK